MEAVKPRAKERNKASAELQITAEQILQEAYDTRDEPLNKTKVKIADLEELHELQRRKRQEYEDALRRNRLDFGQWMRYAQFEIDQKDFRRARSIFERALEVNSYHVPLWIRYIDSELKNRNINHARNLFDRVTTLLPRVDKFWFRYVQTEETLGNVLGTREVFERWIKWEPDVPCWDAYVNFEKRYEEFTNIRSIFNRYVFVHPYAETWLKWVRFEDEFGEPETVRQVYAGGVDALKSEKLIVSFAHWESLEKEWERARAIYRFGLDHFPDSQVIRDGLSKFEKQYGDKEGIEFSVLSKRKLKYEQELEENPAEYDTWWTYLSLLENYPVEVQRKAYEKSILHTPSYDEKTHWKTYVLLWIRRAVFEETHGEIETTRNVFQQILKILQTQKFTFSKVWILYSNFEIRQGNLVQARKILGRSIGKYPKHKTFRHYIELEIKLKEFDRVRKLYEKYLESFFSSDEVWIEYAELEEDLNDIERARGIYKLAVEVLNSSKVWDRFIEFETDQKNYANARHLFEQQLEENPNNSEVWIKFALYELTVPTNEQLEDYESKLEESGLHEDEFEYEFEVSEEAKQRTRDVFERAIQRFKDGGLKDERIVILEALKQFEDSNGTTDTQKSVENRLPTVVKRIKTLDDGSSEEYYDYVFPDDKKFSKFLENAKKWAQENQ